MKHLFNTLFVLLFVLTTLHAQRYVNVPPEEIDALYTTIQADSAGRVNALPTHTIYLLARDGNYPSVTTIRNLDFFLHIKAADGPGAKPYIYPYANASGSYAGSTFQFYKNAIMENVIIDEARPTGGYGNRANSLYTGVSVKFKGVEIAHDRGGAITIQGDSVKVYLEDCFIHCIGYEKNAGGGNAGNGRLIDVRCPNYVDTISVVNSTVLYISDRHVRNIAPQIKYAKFDHCTFLDNLNQAGAFNMGKVHEFIFTNNICKNMVSRGSHIWEMDKLEQTNPVAERYRLWVAYVDTVFEDSKFRLKNNNVYWDQEIKNIWAKYDSVIDVGVFTPSIMNKLGADSVNAHFSEKITWAKDTDVDFFTFMDSALVSWGPANKNKVLPNNWFWGFQSDVDYSYGTTAASYTAGDNGLPIGDLNWYPDKKVIWETTSVEKTDLIPSAFALEQNYPNPFNPSTKIVYNVPKSGHVKLEVFDILGKHVATLINQEQQFGQYKVDFDGSKISSGVYIYRLSTQDFVLSKKMMLIK